MSSQVLYTMLIALLALERTYELGLSRQNAQWARRRGGVEYGRAHLGWMKLLHIAWFVGCIIEVWYADRPFVPWLAGLCFSLLVLAQALRYWAVRTLGRRWNIAVIVLPGVAVEHSGPYRWLRHPNYLAVVVEGFAVPMIHCAYVTALVFTVLDAWLLRHRIRCEEEALSRHGEFAERLGDRPRLLPRW